MRLTLLILLLFFGIEAQANAGIPVLYFIEPALIFSLLFVIGIEIWVLQKRLRTGFKKTFKAVLISNLITTFIGVPITWLFLLAGQFFFTIIPSRTLYKLGLWMIPAWIEPLDFKTPQESFSIISWAVAYCILIFYLTSSYFESIINYPYLMESHSFSRIRKATWEANAYSYLFLLVMIVFWLNYTGFLDLATLFSQARG